MNNLKCNLRERFICQDEVGSRIFLDITKPWDVVLCFRQVGRVHRHCYNAGGDTPEIADDKLHAGRIASKKIQYYGTAILETLKSNFNLFAV